MWNKFENQQVPKAHTFDTRCLVTKLLPMPIQPSGKSATCKLLGSCMQR